MLAARHHGWTRRPPRTIHVPRCRSALRLTPSFVNAPALSTSAPSRLPERTAAESAPGLTSMSSHDAAPVPSDRRVYSREEIFADARRAAWEVLKIEKLSAKQEDAILALLGGQSVCLLWPRQYYDPLAERYCPSRRCLVSASSDS